MVAQHGDVLVVGAGVMGLTTAVCLAEAGVPVRVQAGESPQDTTSAVAGAMIAGPVTDDPQDDESRWLRATLREFTDLAADPRTGVRIARGRTVSRDEDTTPGWARQMADFAECDEAERAGYPMGFWMSSPVVDMPRYLQYLAGRLEIAGGVVQLGAVESLEAAAATAPLVVNCTGVGAQRLTGDPQLKPVRGQHVVVENPGLTEFFYERTKAAEITSFIPHLKRLVLGGTIGPGDWSLEPDPAQTEAILRRCIAIEPRIAGAPVLSVEVGLRPARPQARLEEETLGDARVIHNYGHGGAGIGMSWGCAREIEQMVTQAVRR
ncbi:FAD-dependent oxidoreductase [Dactylosporangium sp. NPDC050688]|uniref:FAD-dependent oxidoreductase n=1 Tax=Dactylosporangium sp. NPDC050688 TaxID=3157217 RepID=UPI0034081B77